MRRVFKLLGLKVEPGNLSSNLPDKYIIGPRLTFADALAFVRRYLWASRLFQTSPDDLEYVEVPRPIFDTWAKLLCHAA